MPSSILGKIANGMYNFAKNAYKGYKNPTTVTSILGHINSSNWKAGLGYMTGSIIARMRGKRATSYTPGPAKTAGADGGPPPLRTTNPPKSLANAPGNTSSQYPNNTGKGNAGGVHILPAKPPSNKTPRNITSSTATKSPSNKSPSNKTTTNKTTTNKSKNKVM
jgi:hypothetical protein